jgi:hypothetical protein
VVRAFFISRSQCASSALDSQAKISLRSLRNGCATLNFFAQFKAMNFQVKISLRSQRNRCAG